MRHRLRWRLSAPLLAAVGPAALAAATPLPYCKPPTAETPNPTIDKNELAGFLLDQAKVSRHIEDVIATSTLTPHQEQPYHIRALLNATAHCDQLGCSKDDLTSLNDARSSISDLEGDPDLVFSRTPSSVDDLLTNPQITLTCKKAASAAPVASPSGEDVAVSPSAGSGQLSSGFDPAAFRIRDKAENLVFSRDSPSYADAGKATISFGDDRIADKQTVKIVGGIGYPIQLDTVSTAGFDLIPSLIPFGAVDIETAKTSGKPKSVTNDTIAFGVVLDAAIGNRVARGQPSSGEDIALVPKFILNNDDHSRVLGANLIFRPFPIRGINTPRDLAIIPFDWNLVVNARFDNGHFTAIGTRDPAETKDFSRVGGELGMVLASARNFPVPLDLTVSDIYLYALAGDPHHLSLLSSDLTFYFNRDKHFGLDLSYSRGRAEDLDEAEHKWSVGLSVKY